MNKTILLTSITLAIGFSAQAQSTLADWTFQTSVPASAGPFSPEIGSGSASGSHAGAAVYSSPAGNGSSHSFSANTWAVGDYYQIQVSTAGYDGITLSYDQTSSSTGPSTFQLQYSLDGSTFTQIGSDYTVLANAAPNPVWNATTGSSIYTFTPDLSAILALDNASTVYFRFADDSTTAENGNAVATAGTDRMDNIIVDGTAIVPEPSTLALFGIGSTVCLGFLRRFKK